MRRAEPLDALRAQQFLRRGHLALAGVQLRIARIGPALLADLDAAARQRPELAGARARILAAGHDVSAANAAFLPQVGLFGMADFFASRMNDMDRWEEYTVGVGVSLPLFDGGMRSAQVRRARAERARLTALEQDAALKVARDVAQAHERSAAARTNIATAVAELPHVSAAHWSTPSTLQVVADSEAFDPQSICPLLEDDLELGASRLQVQYPAGSQRPVRFSQCRAY